MNPNRRHLQETDVFFVPCLSCMVTGNMVNAGGAKDDVGVGSD